MLAGISAHEMATDGGFMAPAREDMANLEPLIQSEEYQAISKTRLWKEIFYLRGQVQLNNRVNAQLQDKVRELDKKLESETRSKIVIQNQLTHLRNQYFTGQANQPVSGRQGMLSGIRQPPLLQYELQSKAMAGGQRHALQSEHSSSQASLFQQQQMAMLGNTEQIEESKHESASALSAQHTQRSIGFANPHIFNPPMKASQTRPSLQNDSSFAGGPPQVDDENNQFTSNESILINKVNEMHTKTASFGFQPSIADRVYHSSTQPRQVVFGLNQSPTDKVSPEHEAHFLPHQSFGQSRNARASQPAAQSAILYPLGRSSLMSEGIQNYDHGNLLTGPPSGRTTQQRSEEGEQQVSVRQNLTTSSISLANQRQVPMPPAFQTQNFLGAPQLHHTGLLQQQRPCEQPPPRNIRGDVHSHVDGEDFLALEGVGSGLVPQQRIPLPNQQQQPMPRQPSHDSLQDHDIQPLQSLRRHQHFHMQQVRAPSVDDAGMDEFDVADERLHLFGEQVNPDIMTYEQLLALQERIGFVPKGMTVQEMDRFPTMKRRDVRSYLKGGNEKRAVRSVLVSEVGALQEEEHKSLLDQESLNDKSIQISSQDSFGIHAVPSGTSINQRGRHTHESQLENYQQMQNTQVVRAAKSQKGLHSARQSLQVQLRGLEDAKEDTELDSGLLGNSDILTNEEGKEDLEEAAPEEHHPKEEHLQQIGASVPMPGHHIASQAGQRLRNRVPQVVMSPMTEEVQDISQEASHEDVFDEGEDVLNRRLPIVVNINGSIQSQRPSRPQPSLLDTDVQRQHPLYAGAIAIQSNLQRAMRISQLSELPVEEEIALSSNVIEEHKADEHGVQTPKYAQTRAHQHRARLDQVNRRTQALQGLENKGTEEGIEHRVIEHRVPMVKHRAMAQIDPQEMFRQSLELQKMSASQNQSMRSVSTTLGQEVCIICQEVFSAEDVVKMIPPCKHYFHVDCVNQWLLVEKKCPMCMHPLN